MGEGAKKGRDNNAENRKDLTWHFPLPDSHVSYQQDLKGNKRPAHKRAFYKKIFRLY
jgi:hypothetical protein